MKDKQIKFFASICKRNQMELKSYLERWMRRFYNGDIINENGFLYVRGTDNVLLTAHMDTVHKSQCQSVEVKKLMSGSIILSSPDGIGGDDRCGIFIIMKIVETTKLRPSILFCEDEEIGSVGADKFVNSQYAKDLNDMLFLIELDRANDDDVVYYRDINREFQKFCEDVTGYKRAYGTRSDISVLAPKCKKSAVNLSCGYYNAHRITEYVAFNQMMNTVEVTIRLISEGIKNNVSYEYKTWSDTHYGSYDYEPYYNNLYNNDSLKRREKWYSFKTENGFSYWGYGASFREALGDVLMKNPKMTFEMIKDYSAYDY